MKIIDKTPLQKENGQIDLLGRIQGTLKYGFSWYPDLQAQTAVIAQLQRSIEKGFVLIRNLALPGSEIVVPLILVGPQGINIIYVTHIKGFFEAKGDEWNTVVKGRSQPAGVNLISRVKLLARAVQTYLQRQNIQLNGPIEPVLIGNDPGFHVESTRPSVRVIMSDAVRGFAASLLQARPAMGVQQVYELADRILLPRTPEELAAAQIPLEQEGPSRARAIFDASETAEPFDPSELSFAFDDGSELAPELRENSPARPLPRPGKKSRTLGMSPRQLLLLGFMMVIECCVLAAGFYIISTQ
jgi:hypothetical protein